MLIHVHNPLVSSDFRMAQPEDVCANSCIDRYPGGAGGKTGVRCLPPSKPSKKIRVKTIKNIGYQGVAQVVTYSLQAATSVVLARYLSARDYGIVGYAAIFVAFLGQFDDLGLGSALVQRKELDDRATNTAFTARIILGSAAFTAAMVASRIARFSFGEPVVSTVIVVLSLDFLISSLSFIPSFLMIRALDYRRWIQPMIVAAIVRTAGACWLAMHGFGFWSIVIPTVAASIAQTIWFLYLGRPKLRIGWDRGIARQLLSFGLPLFSSGLLTFLLFNVDNFMIGTVSGAVLLGYYAIAFNWGARNMPLLSMRSFILCCFPPWRRFRTTGSACGGFIFESWNS